MPLQTDAPSSADMEATWDKYSSIFHVTVTRKQHVQYVMFTRQIHVKSSHVNGVSTPKRVLYVLC